LEGGQTARNIVGGGEKGDAIGLFKGEEGREKFVITTMNKRRNPPLIRKLWRMGSQLWNSKR